MSGAREFRAQRARGWAERMNRQVTRANQLPSPPVEGSLTRMVGLALEASGCQAAVGDVCDLLNGDGTKVEAEVVGFAGDKLYLMPTGEVHGLAPAARVVPRQRAGSVPVGPGLLGRVIDGNGVPLDGLGPIQSDERVKLLGKTINPLARHPIDTPLDVGVRSLNALLTVGRGQRIGLFAGSGVGKSVLLGMMARYTSADVIVVGLIGERGREVKEFVDRILGPEGRRRSVVVASPADNPPLIRLHGAWLATSIAEYFRERGLSVLLIMDSLTRFAQAQREIGLSVGEPPTTRGYPPSVFARLPQLVERAGNGAEGQGSITAFYTVLTEGDDQQEPIADAARAILDGHIVLSRSVAESGRYPAIDVESSISRVANEITDQPWREDIRRVRQWMSAYANHRDLIAIGAYQRGADPRVDEAIQYWPALNTFLNQDVAESTDTAASRAALAKLVGSA
jgi:flagellum-specific ATP synthase